LGLREQFLGLRRLTIGDQYGGRVLTGSRVVEQTTAATSQLDRFDEQLRVVLDEATASKGGTLHGGDLGRERPACVDARGHATGDVAPVEGEAKPNEGGAEVAVVVPDLALTVVLPESEQQLERLVRFCAGFGKC
jgi:hypothetical protein